MARRREPSPQFRWWAGGFALLAGCLFLARFLTGDRPSLLFGVPCLALAGYWLLFDREPGFDREPTLDREPGFGVGGRTGPVPADRDQPGGEDIHPDTEAVDPED